MRRHTAVDPLTLAIDVGPVRYKQVLKKLIAAEQASVAPPQDGTPRDFVLKNPLTALDGGKPNDECRRFFFANGGYPVDAPTARHPQALSLGALVVEGKTKKIFRINGSDLVSVVAKDDITAGDGAKHDVIPDKGALATRPPATCSGC